MSRIMNPEFDLDYSGSELRSCAYGTWKKESVLRNTVTGVELEDAGSFIWNDEEGII